VNYFDKEIDLKLSSRDITCLMIVGSHATILGTGEAGGALVVFQVDLNDNSKNGKTDTFSITLSNGYSRSGVLQDGNIKIDSCGMTRNDRNGDQDRDDDHDRNGHAKDDELSLTAVGEPNSNLSSILYDSLFRFYDDSKLRNFLLGL